MRDPWAPPPPPDPSPAVIDVLTSHDWEDAPGAWQVRMIFRKAEMSGLYERRRPGGRTTSQTFLFKVREGKTLLMKFSGVPVWGDVELELREGKSPELTLSKDPFHALVEETESAPLQLKAVPKQ